MNKIIAISALIVLSFNASSQGWHLDISNTGSDIVFSTFFGEHDSTYLINLYKKGEKAYFNNDYESAKKKLIKFISIPSPVTDTAFWSAPGYRFMHMKNNASGYLQNITFTEKDYEEALYYHTLHKKTYHLSLPRCGNEIYDGIYSLTPDQLFVSACYEGMGDYDNAIKAILPTSYFFFKTNFEERFVQLAIKKTSFENLRIDLENSLNLVYNNTAFYVHLAGFDVPVFYLGLKYEKRGANQKVINENGEIEVIVQRKIGIPPTEEEIAEARNKAKEDFKNNKLYKLIMEN